MKDSNETTIKLENLTVYETVSCIQQLHARYALRTCDYAHNWL